MTDKQIDFQVQQVDGGIEICAAGEFVTTVDELAVKAGLDTDSWICIDTEAKVAPVTMKLRDSDGKERPYSFQNWYLRGRWQPRAPEPVQKSIRWLVKNWQESPAREKPKRPKVRERHMLVLSLYDHHFGKLCWGKETSTSYDTEIAARMYVNAVKKLLAQASAAYQIDRIVIPLGNDFFHVNSWMGNTAAGTGVGIPDERSRGDDRFSKVFRSGCRAVREAIEYCREVADVHCLWVPGNHDPETSFYLCEVLDAWFHQDKAVTFDIGPNVRKDYVYGKVLLRFTHGDVSKSKLKWLPLNLAVEERKLWGDASWVEIHIGHYHAKQTMEFLSLDEFQGVRLRVLPSLCGTDSWHYKNLWVKSRRAAEGLIYSKKEGYVGEFAVNSNSL